MKNNNKFLISILVCLLIVSCVFVGYLLSFSNDEKNNNRLTLNCDADSIKDNDVLKCNLKGNITEYDVSSVSAKIEKSNDFNLLEVEVDSSWQGDGENGFIAVYTDKNKSNEFDIASFTISLVNDDIDKININLVDIVFSDENYEDHKLENVTKTLEVNR